MFTHIIGIIIVLIAIVIAVIMFIAVMKYDINVPIFKTTVTITPNDEVNFDALRKASGWDKKEDGVKPDVSEDKETKAEVVNITEKDGKIILTLKTDDNKR